MISPRKEALYNPTSQIRLGGTLFWSCLGEMRELKNLIPSLTQNDLSLIEEDLCLSSSSAKDNMELTEADHSNTQNDTTSQEDDKPTQNLPDMILQMLSDLTLVQDTITANDMSEAHQILLDAHQKLQIIIYFF